WDEIIETLQGAPVSTDTELGAHVRDFESMVKRDTYEIYTLLDDEQSQRQLLASRVNMLFRDRHTTERDDSTSGTGHYTAGAGDSLTGTGDDITGAGYCITGTTGTRWGSYTARAARRGW
ncbi:hypothetical protein Tco_0188537, partial [Tanacetum coccineum]